MVFRSRGKIVSHGCRNWLRVRLQRLHVNGAVGRFSILRGFGDEATIYVEAGPELETTLRKLVSEACIAPAVTEATELHADDWFALIERDAA